MKWAYDLSGAEPIIKDLVMYDAATIAQGEMVMAMAGDFTVGTGAGGVISAYSTTVVTAHAVNAAGVCLETKTTANTPSIATATDTTAAPCYGKVIINPLAVWRAEHLTTGQTAITAWSGTTLTVANAATAATWVSPTWVYFSNSAGPNFGELRFVLDSATANTFTVDSAPAVTATTADMWIGVPGKMGFSNGLEDNAIGLECGSVVHKIQACTALRVIEAYVDGDQGFEILKQGIHKGCKRKKAGKAAKLYNDILCIDHMYIT